MTANNSAALSATPPELELLDFIQRGAFKYFLDFTNPRNGLVADSTFPTAPCSIAAVGLALACYACGAERAFVPRTEAAERALMTLRFFHSSRQGPEPEATGYQGFYYHFLDMHTGARSPGSELSTIDSGYLLAGGAVSRHLLRP